MSATSPSFLSGLQVSRYFNVAGFVILVYDYCIMLETEMHWIWGTRWNTIRITFTVARYLPFVVVIMNIYSAMVTRTGNCEPLRYTLAVLSILGAAAAEGLLIHRTYTFWNGSKCLLLWLLGFALILTLMAVLLPDELELHAPIGYVNSNGCLFTSSRGTAIEFGLLILYEFVMLYLIVSSPMTLNVYCNVMIYISCIILVTLMDLIVTAFAPIAYTFTLFTIQTTTHSILSSRVLFDLRQSESLE